MASWSGWEAQVLRSIGAPITRQNLLFIQAWQRAEGGSASFNPLNTTQGYSGASNYNSVGVKNYPSQAAGTEATRQTLLNGRYPNVVAALRSGNPFGYANRSGMANEVRTWGTGPFADEILKAPKAAGGQSFGSSLIHSPVTIATGAVKAGEDVVGVAQGAGSAVAAPFKAGEAVGQAFSWTFSNWDRVLEVVAGFVLLLIGTILLGRQMLGRAQGSDVGQLAAAIREARRDPFQEAYAQGQVQGARRAGRESIAREGTRRGEGVETVAGPARRTRAAATNGSGPSESIPY